MERLGQTISTRPTPSEQEKSAGYLSHVLELNRVLIYPHLLSRRISGIYLSEWRHDFDMQHHKTRLPDLNGKKRFLVPDGFLDFHLSAPFGTQENGRMSLVIELDRGTMTNVWRFQERIRDYCDFVYGAYQRDFGSNSLTILWVTTAGWKRVQKMRQWTRGELTRLHKTEHARYHRFLAIPPLFSSTVLPEVFFLSPVWLTLEHDTPVALIEKIP